MEHNRNHFVLVHGACHGAWCWYKVKPMLERAGHRVTTLDLAACGINLTNLADVHTLSEYSEPLIKFLESLGEEEKVILVGHSLGGMNVAFAAEKFPEKIFAVVFVSALLPDTSHQPSYVMEKDLALATTLTRVGPLLGNDLSNIGNKFSEERYGSVARFYVVCKDDNIVSEKFQLWMTQNYAVKEVIELQGADHMAMFSAPQDLCAALLRVARSTPASCHRQPPFQSSPLLLSSRHFLLPLSDRRVISPLYDCLFSPLSGLSRLSCLSFLAFRLSGLSRFSLASFTSRIFGLSSFTSLLSDLSEFLPLFSPEPKEESHRLRKVWFGCVSNEERIERKMLLSEGIWWEKISLYS
ncbi:hypothetical protein Syun_005259 [Stephania yunnanensis]|uniref:AB hydrolase-1 domain-containing protein n=1 Tax=Stephania yunnanensis TaxID=152371 RepID=A0AAP0L5X2_9MAGN